MCTCPRCGARPRCSPKRFAVSMLRSTRRSTWRWLWSGGQCRPVSWNDGSTVGQFCETLENTHSPSCMIRSTSNSTPSRYCSTNRSLPAAKRSTARRPIRHRGPSVYTSGKDSTSSTRTHPTAASTELGFDHRGEPDVARRREQFVERRALGEPSASGDRARWTAREFEPCCVRHRRRPVGCRGDRAALPRAPRRRC